MKAHYDYIIAGAGCAGLSLLTRMITSQAFADKKILLVDKAEKNRNDRTWCFWEKDEGYFEEIVYNRWDTLWFHGKDFSKRYPISPYQYKMIRGIDFYDHCFRLIRQAANIDVRYGEVEELKSGQTETSIRINDKQITASFIFNSIFPRPFLGSKNEHQLLQHFRGWFLRMREPAFVPGEATLMDFRVSQEKGATFVYVMPFSQTDALVEYTLFSGELLNMEAYEQGLMDYLNRYYPGVSYDILDREFGIIPMTNRKYAVHDGKKLNEFNIVHIGSAGGQTKPSSGYTFQFIQKQSNLIINDLISGLHPGKRRPTTGKFHFYDSVLLNVLATQKMGGDKLFTTMFRKNRIQDIFSFLDNESGLPTDLSIISSLPIGPFLRAGIEESVKK